MTATALQDHPALAGLTVLERGWLSSNNTLVHAADDEPGAMLIDTGHVNHADQTLALVRHALAQRLGQRLDRIVNTHLHSDHCGGNATLQRAFGVPVYLPPGEAAAAAAWDEDVLSYRATGQRCERFTVHGSFAPGEELRAGGRRWQVLAAPGHDPHSVMLFDAEHGLLISADALWEHGFGVVFPEVAGEPGFGDVGAVLDLIATLPVKLVIPGHGAPFTDVQAALGRARSRLAAFQAEPVRHAKHAIKVMMKYHLMEERQQPRDDLLAWSVATPLFAGVWPQLGGARSNAQWCEQMLDELLAAGVLVQAGEVVQDV